MKLTKSEVERMNKNVLTLLGCSGSLALMLVTTKMVTADTTQSTDAPSPEATGFVDRTFSAPAAPASALSQPSVNPQYANPDAASDTIGDLAIDKFRCDCNPCRTAVMQMLQTGQLAL